MTAAARAPTIAAATAHLGSPPDPRTSQAATAAPAKIRMAIASDESKTRSSRAMKGCRGMAGTSGTSSTANLRATELATSLGTDHDINVGAVETRTQQATDRCIR